MMYWQICAIVLAAGLGIAAVTRAAGARVRLAAAAVALGGLAVATAVFDNIMIALGLFDYDRSTLVGLNIAQAPIEDFTYPLLAVLILPGLWLALGRLSERDWRTILRSSRPVSWINTAYPFAAALLLTRGEIDTALIVGTLFFLIPYNLLMYGINDVFDYESDLRNPRKGGIEGAVLERRLHAPVIATGALLALPGFVYLLVSGGLASGIVLILCLAGVLAYSMPPLRTKERAVADSVTSSLHFVGPAIFGLVLGDAVWTPGLICLLVAFFLWGAASHLFGAVQDVNADRAAGIGSSATAWGARAAARVSVLLYLGAGIAALGIPGWGRLAALLVIPYLVLTLPSWNITDATAERANRGWRGFLLVNQFTGFAVTMLLIVTALGALQG
ncbi:prenyltransferase [Mycetocola tolaasinivorans]|uniref:Prenyltransferase n=1 Tax=Mycetocola tolaasinivorans TaxID=76635 RepID=A0A3L7AF39_9MICO|nr:prenyltransferase [Mycetocola tolaasinivorans]RLP78012.1 prenyltransferase [Mycetocola tolaasinivorans]